MSITVIEPGILSTVQDMGRWELQQYGVPVSGVMDTYSASMANLLVGNNLNAALLELTLCGPVLRFDAPAVIALTGADMPLLINGNPVARWESHHINAGDEVNIGSASAGSRGYLAVAGGLDFPLTMGSRATFVRGKLGGIEGRNLNKSDCIRVGSDTPGVAGNFVPRSLTQPLPGEMTPIRVMSGPQADLFTDESLLILQTKPYTVTSESDRMGYRLCGEKLFHREKADILSDGIAPGSIQVPGHGQPIIMLADRQSIGGYAKIATVIGADLPLLAQVRPGQEIRFVVVSREDAVAALREQRRQLAVGPTSGGLIRHYRVNIGSDTMTAHLQEMKRE